MSDNPVTDALGGPEGHARALREAADRIVRAPASETEPDEMTAAAVGLEPPDMPPMVPHVFTQPMRTPLAIVCDVYEEEGSGWVAMRAETQLGSFVFFLTAEVATNLSADLANKANAARIRLHRPDNGDS